MAFEAGYPVEVFKDKEKKRAERLLEFVKGELREMWVDARFDFTTAILRYLEPEIKELERRAFGNG